jgi:hypothetical protein
MPQRRAGARLGLQTFAGMSSMESPQINRSSCHPTVAEAWLRFRRPGVARAVLNIYDFVKAA